MWLEEAAGAAGGLALAALLLALAAPASAAGAANALRLAHFDLHQAPHGCRSSAVNLEARSLASWSTSRHCVVAHLKDISVDQFLEIRSKAGALLLLLPKNINDLTVTEKEHLLLLENAMSQQEILIPVYFIPWSPDINAIVDDLNSGLMKNDKYDTALDNLLNMALANGYQIVISSGTNQKQEAKVATLHGQLIGQESAGKSNNAKLPTVAIVAHYDSAAIAPELAIGADSNASGVSILLELARIFSQLYSTSSTRGPANLVFLLTGAAHMNYYSTKKWIEDQLDSTEGSIIQDASFVVCLDSLASDKSVIMHVSKPPKDGSPINLFYNQLKQAAATHGAYAVEGIHKKINLADENLAWEHERFSIRRLSAFTLSSLKSHKSFSRSSIIDNVDAVDKTTLITNAQIIADALAGYLYNISASDYSAIFSGSLTVDGDSIESWMRYLTMQPRATQFVSQGQSPVVSMLSDTLSRYLPDLSTNYYSPDKRDPEFSTYLPTSAPLNIYNVKPAVFDLILTLAIVLYLGVVYLFIYKFPFVYQQFIGSGKYKSQ